MNSFICSTCRASLRKTSRIRGIPAIRHNSSSSTPNPQPGSPKATPEPLKTPFDIASFLSTPSWSVRALFPDPTTPLKQEITPKQLHHLLRLSALPQPKSPDEEAEMLKTLHTQLHFVRDIQSVNTEGVEPLQSIRDETTAGIKASTITLESLRHALEEEGVTPRNRRPRRVVEQVPKADPRKTPVVRIENSTMGTSENWDVMATAGEKVVTPSGSYFVVRSGEVGEERLSRGGPTSVDEGENRL
ncbi:hypothetical protein HYALB_00011940 [Hymenoscyphus albidus]|uniref:Glutamyl-tRNA amidotransferase complex subunit Gta3 domain-containing protein n=1 Tax=Hymenoscyphus albidus TaxID=595503 RepID=A0A9N9Q0Q4_9HELO|nr:hypothetical protein HYALB_00011940 [Hymenoscyphus albidus]